MTINKNTRRAACSCIADILKLHFGSRKGSLTEQTTAK